MKPIPAALQFRFVHKPKRLTQVYSCYSSPIYFITSVTARRAKILANPVAQKAFEQYGRANAANGRCIGGYILMPDHLHAFMRLDSGSRLSAFVRLMKQSISMALKVEGIVRHDDAVWQPGFFDHLLRHSESYSEKWKYVRNNSVRAGLVSTPEEWPYQGEIVTLRF